MNGQPLTNSSNSANGTPSSSYPGSISSQSSRDPSPATRVRKPLPEPYNNVMTGSNHWPPQPTKGGEPLPHPQSSSPATLPPPTTSSQPLSQDMKQPVAHFNNQPQIPTSSQPVHKYPPPTSLPPSSTSQTNSMPQTNNTFRSTNQQPTNTQLTDQPRPTQVLPQNPTLNNSSVLNSSASLFSSQPNQFKPADAPFQQYVNKLQHSPVIQAPSKPLQSSQTSQATIQPIQQQNQFTSSSQLPSKTHSQGPFQNQFSSNSQQSSQTQPFQNKLPTTSQPLSQNQLSSTSQLPSQPTSFQNQFSQPPKQFNLPPGQAPPQSAFPPGQTPSQNAFPSGQPRTQSAFPPGQPPPQSAFPPAQPPPQSVFPPGQPPPQSVFPPGHPPPQSTFPPSSNQFPQPPGKMMPPQSSGPPQASQISQPPSQIPPSKNRYPQYPSQMPPVANQSIPPTIQNQTSYHSSQFAKMPVQAQPHPNEFPPTNQTPPIQNKYPQPGQPPSYQNHFPQQPNQVNSFQKQYPNSGYQPQSQNQVPSQFNNRYPQMPGTADSLAPNMAGLTVNQGFNRLWGMDSVDLLKCRDLLPRGKVEPPPIRLQHELYEAANCSPDIFRCTLTKIPETKSLLDKSRLPLGVLIHPFKDLNQLSVIQCAVIVRCRMCRTYINPFVYFVDNKRWKCNLCFRVNELPDEFQFDPMTKTYGDPSRRPEIKSATIEFIAPSEYMVRPPQPAVYVFLLDVSRLACESGYLDTVCQTLLAELDNIPGDARTSIAFITYDSAIHFFSLTEGQGQPHQMTVVDIDDVFLPTPDNLMVNLADCRELIRDLLEKLPSKYKESYDTHSALGAALQVAYKLLAPTGGRVTVFQSCLPNAGPGALTPREDPSQRAGDNPPHLNPSTDFYKKLALDCSGQQIAVDLFLINSQYIDLATISGVSKFSGGCMFHIPLFRSDKPHMVDTLERSFQRYLTRKIGFESVMRIRCTRGLSIHTFHGNFFVRSTDLLSLPNANPDAGFGMQVTIDENLSDVQNVSFQAALLYTSSKGERRIRVHTLCLPVASNLADILHGADQQCIVGLLSKMAVDRAAQSSLSDAREAFFNVVGDVLSSYKLTQTSNTTGLLLAPSNLSLLPVYILALLKHTAFRVGQSTRLDDRVFAMCQMKTLPLHLLMQSVYPDLYSLRDVETQVETATGVPQVPRLQLSAERIDSLGLFLMDDGCSLMLYIGHNLPPHTCQAVFDVPHFSAIPQDLYSLPELETPTSEAIRNFIAHLQNEKPFPIPLQIIRDDSHHRMKFLERLIEDKNECGTSYYEFLQRVKTLLT